MSSHHTQKIPISQSLSGVFPIYKAAGETLASLVARFRIEQSLSDEMPITYAGRLDPMASGLVLLLVGEMCKQKDDFLGLDKTYVFEILFGVSTDSFDMLGLITDQLEVLPNEEHIRSVLPNIQNMTVFPYPPFSSKPVDGVPLFTYAKSGTLPTVMPTMTGEIKELTLKNSRTELFGDVVGEAIKIIERVEGDFRQKDIVGGWWQFLVEKKDQHCVIATFEATVTTGVYIRTLATLIGEALGTPALAYSIERKAVGEYTLENK
jgi:tRNA pseudouridine(55) synthase